MTSTNTMVPDRNGAGLLLAVMAVGAFPVGIAVANGGPWGADPRLGLLMMPVAAWQPVKAKLRRLRARPPRGPQEA